MEDKGEPSAVEQLHTVKTWREEKLDSSTAGVCSYKKKAEGEVKVVWISRTNALQIKAFPSKKRKPQSVCDPVDQTNFPLVKQSKARSGVCVSRQEKIVF